MSIIHEFIKSKIWNSMELYHSEPISGNLKFGKYSQSRTCSDNSLNSLNSENSLYFGNYGIHHS